MSKILRVVTISKLGVPSLIRLALYRLGISLGINPVKRLEQPSIPKEDFFRRSSSLSSEFPCAGVVRPFGWKPEQSITDVAWSENVLTGRSYANMTDSWFLLSDFDSGAGDIKGVWELSRFGWSLSLAQDYLLGRTAALYELNAACSDWLEHNQTYKGPNWKCGQEASIRVMHLAFTAKLLSQVSSPEPVLIVLVKAHLERIAPTISYAVAQDNNHGTSEAAALFIGGSWLLHAGDTAGKKWQSLGRKWLENRAMHLIDREGSFSQYSVNYHRVMLDTYVMAELWRQELKLESFGDALYGKLRAATNWLYQFTQSVNGYAPNLGHNDGAQLLPLSDSDYRDYRPSVQLASAVFYQATAWQDRGGYDDPLTWLGVTRPNRQLEPVESFHFEEGGYIGLRGAEEAFVLFNYPRFRFRPAQSDALHVDFWHKGINLLRDGGTFSYNAGQPYIDYYGGTESHNTVQFDGRDQMPRLSRFLLGAWLKAKAVVWEQESNYCSASYKDYLGCVHKREVKLTDSQLQVVDCFSGFKKKAVLRWRLAPGEWAIQGNKLTNKTSTITIQSDMEVQRFELVEGRESRYYYQETTIPVLEIEVSSSGKIMTEYNYQ